MHQNNDEQLEKWGADNCQVCQSPSVTGHHHRPSQAKLSQVKLNAKSSQAKTNRATSSPNQLESARSRVVSSLCARIFGWIRHFDFLMFLTCWETELWNKSVTCSSVLQPIVCSKCSSFGSSVFVDCIKCAPFFSQLTVLVVWVFTLPQHFIRQVKRSESVTCTKRKWL